MSQSKDYTITSIHDAVRFKNVHVIESLLKNGADPNIVDDQGLTALNLICYQPDLKEVQFEMIRLLIQYNADVNIYDKDGYNPMMNLFVEASNDTEFHMRIKVFKLLLENKADVTHVNNDGDTILHVTVWDAENPKIVEAVELLLKYGADPNVVDTEGMTPLNLICDSYYSNNVRLKLIRLIIQYKADVNIKDKKGNSPIMTIVANCDYYNIELHMKIFTLLLENDADVTNIEYENGQTIMHKLLHLSSWNPCIVEAVELLLEHGVDVNIQTISGLTCLHLAVYYQDLELVELLLEYGANFNITDLDGNIPLNYTFKNLRFKEFGVTLDFEKILQLVMLHVENNADLTCMSKDGKTALHSLVINLSMYTSKHYDNMDFEPMMKYVHKCIKILLKNGLDVNIQDRDGRSPLNEAVSYCNYNLVKFLIEHGADMSTVRFKGGFLEGQSSVLRNLKMTQNILAIVDFLESKGFQMNKDQWLLICQFLIRFDLPDETKFNTVCYVWKTLEFGSDLMIKKLVEKLPSMDWNRSIKEMIYETVHEHLYTVEHGKIYMDVEIHNYLREKLNSPAVQTMVETSYQFEEEIKEEIDEAKRTMIGNNISLLDLCTSSPEKTYKLLKNCDYKSVVNSEDFIDDFWIVGRTIKGHIIKSLVRRLITQLTSDCVPLLTKGVLPDLCCEKIIKYLGNEDLLSLYESVIDEL
ncbi:uncharacterized protein LOC106655674 [Trichogramma pretiosum]|uniref:uncharacterized protein LOC106655674 n=1 Tax=Trichogramma pretiosum TaxID=7493 RepID=UPI0006C997B3|nr:uncharacterized protein LOC106655674 [Trichogramma pretiosum]